MAHTPEELQELMVGLTETQQTVFMKGYTVAMAHAIKVIEDKLGAGST